MRRRGAAGARGAKGAAVSLLDLTRAGGEVVIAAPVAPRHPEQLDLAAPAALCAPTACAAFYTPAGRANSTGPDPKVGSSAITAPRACRRAQAAGYGENGVPLA